jgi:hypothetical protein
VIETVLRRRESNYKKTWLCAAKLQFGLAHRTVRWCIGQCPVRQTGPRELAALGTRRRRTTKNHRTVRWCTGLSGESSAVNSSLSGNRKGDMSIIHRTVRWCTRLSGEPTVAIANGRPHNLPVTRGSSNSRRVAPDYPVCTGQCPVSQRARSCNGRLCPIWKAITHRTVYRTCTVAPRTVRCATRHKATITFLVGLQTTPRCLGAIKGTLRRME